MAEFDDQINNDPHFWDDPQRSSQILKKKKELSDKIKKIHGIRTLGEDLKAALELASESQDFFNEAEALLIQLSTCLKDFEIELTLQGKFDNQDALLTINAGSGGTESCDWAAMLLRMYTRFCEQKGWSVELHDVQSGDEAGIKSVTLEVQGPFAFGLLKGEIGVHRLVRISPFDSNSRRHTSFASVFIAPVVDDTIEIHIAPNDLRVDTYRASGAGGQHVNRTDSAVRLTHLPTGIVTQCQSQRSQHQNKETAMKILRSKLYELQLEERKKEQKSTEASKAEIGFGSQIRSYVLHPYKMVKDHRTEHESRDPSSVLDGELNSFIYGFLEKQLRKT
ncbi:MAG: peptide chain release factor 2 [Zetaproteobacteria bacterium]|nr:peptide chain release factor 2 [Pseudobdellovibrionaceae bacterium]